jgi:hypothetical protein
MARKSRVHLPGDLYHVMLRGNGGQEIFFDDADRVYFETWVLSRFAERLQHARQGYAAFVAAGPAEGYLEHFHGGAEGGRMLGDDTFIEQTLRAVQSEPVKPPTLSQLLNEICSRRSLEGAELAKRNPGSSWPKQ